MYSRRNSSKCLHDLQHYWWKLSKSHINHSHWTVMQNSSFQKNAIINFTRHKNHRCWAVLVKNRIVNRQVIASSDRGYLPFWHQNARVVEAWDHNSEERRVDSIEKKSISKISKWIIDYDPQILSKKLVNSNNNLAIKTKIKQLFSFPLSRSQQNSRYICNNLSRSNKNPQQLGLDP